MKKYTGRDQMKMRLGRRFKALQLLVVLMAVLGAESAAFAATMTDIQFTPRPGGRFEVKLKFDAPVSQPKGYTIERPARIALDFAGVSSGLSQKKIPIKF